MRPARVLACAILSYSAALLVVGWEVPRPSRPEGQPPTVNVLVAVRELKQGFVLSDPENLFELRELPPDSVPANAVTASNSREFGERLRELWGKQLAHTLKEG